MIDKFFNLVQGSRIKETVLQGLRIGQYPDGSKRVQGAYLCSDGWKEWIGWKDLPLVLVDEEGKALNG